MLDTYDSRYTTESSPWVYNAGVWSTQLSHLSPPPLGKAPPVFVVAVILLDGAGVELGGDGTKICNDDGGGGSRCADSGIANAGSPISLEGNGKGIASIDLFQCQTMGTATTPDSLFGIGGVEVVPAGGQCHLPGPAGHLGADEGEMVVGVDGDGRRGTIRRRRRR